MPEMDLNQIILMQTSNFPQQNQIGQATLESVVGSLKNGGPSSRTNILSPVGKKEEEKLKFKSVRNQNLRPNSEPPQE